mmetsp:Transcript_650/g.1547  ORF Transcript_650/g.1547 Transcript_650/m.1547 type:complete len:358 (+) Transcript_650:238-1311(+)
MRILFWQHHLYANVLALSSLGKSFKDSSGDLSRTQFISLFKVFGQYQVHGVLPQDGRCHLSSQQLLDCFGIGVGLGINIADDRNARLLDFDLLQDIFQRRNSRSHEVRVEGTCYSQPDGHAGFEFWLGDFGKCIAGGGGTTYGVVSFAQEVGNLNLFATLFASNFTKFFDLLAVESNDRNHTGIDGISSGLHRLSTSLGDLDTIGEGDGASEAQGRVFTQTQSHSAGGFIDRFGTGILLQLFYGSHTGNEDSGLRNHGGIKFLFGAFSADFKQIVTQDFACFIEEGLGCRNFGNNFAAHTDRLCSLSREHEGDLRREVVEVIVAGSNLCQRAAERFSGRDKGRRQPRGCSQQNHGVR